MRGLSFVIRWLLPPASVLAIAFALWLFNSEQGLRWALNFAKPYLPAELRLENVRGKLGGPILVDALHYRNDDFSLDGKSLLINWSPSAVLAGTLRFSQLSADSLDIHINTTADPSPSRPPEIGVPFPASIGSLTVKHMTIRAPDMTPIVMDDLEGQADMLGHKVDIERLTFNAFGAQIETDGNIALRHSYPHDLKIRWRILETPYGIVTGDGRLRGDFDNARLDQKIISPVKAVADFELIDLWNRPHWRGTLNVAPVLLQTLAPDLPPFRLGVRTTLDGDLQTQSALGSFSSDSAALGPLDGQFDLRFSGDVIWIDSLEIVTADKSRAVKAHGNWRMSDDVAELGLSWRGLAWPWRNEAEISSAKGGAYFKGKPDDYILHFAADLETPYWSDGFLSAIGHGTLSGLDFHMARLLTIDGEVQGPVKLDWQDGFSWQTRLNGKGLDPGRRWPQWPGSLSFAVDSNGHTRNGLKATLNVKKLGGKLRGRPVQLRGRFDWENDALKLTDVTYTSADSQVAATGSLGESVRLDWQLKSKDLSDLHPDVHGALRAKGSLRGSRGAPLLTMQLNGEQLVWNGQRIGKIDAKGSADLFNWQSLDMNFHARNTSLYGQSFQEIDARVIAGQTRQVLDLNLKHPAAALSLHAEGNWRQNSWRGVLSDTAVDGGVHGEWRQHRAVDLAFGADHMRLLPLCLDNDGRQLCLNLELDRGVWSGAIDGKNIPLASLSHNLSDTLIPHGDATFDLRAAYDPSKGLNGRGSLQLSPGALDFAVSDEQRESWKYRQGTMDIALDNGRLTAQAFLDAGKENMARANAVLTDFDPFNFDAKQQKVDAHLELNADDPGLLQAFIYEVQDIKGRLHLTGDVGGTLGRPLLNAKLSLSDGAFRIPRLGLLIDKVSFIANTGEKHHVSYQANAHSGEGGLTLTGDADLDAANGWSTRVNIKGENCQVSNIPEAKIDVSPNVDITIRGRRIDSGGVIRIPYARLQPKDIGGAKLPSDDVRILGEEQGKIEKWQTYSNIRLILGDRVTLNGFGFEGRIDGSVLLSDRPNEPTIGAGELGVPEGRYRAYGQKLTIERGRLLFANSPINNPGLDLRAVRHVQEITAGIRVSGTLRAPKFEVFSVPAMGQTNALSYLVLGRPLDAKSRSDSALVADAALSLGLKGGDFLARRLGTMFDLDEMRVEPSDTGDQASLVLGRYLTPKLYVSYGVGLIESFNTLNLRYEISENWQFTTESGKTQGADLSFSFER